MLNHNRLARRLILMRLLWVALAVVFTALYLLTLPQSVAKAQQDPIVWLDIALQAIYLILAWFVFWLRSDDPVAYIFSLILLLALSTDKFQLVFAASPAAQSLDLFFAALSSTLLIWLFYVFPDGRFVPRWTRWAAVAVAGVQLWRVFFEEVYMTRGFPLMGLFMLTAAVAQVYRYRSVSEPVQRQQIKWVVFAFAITLVPLGIVLFAVGIFGLNIFEGSSVAGTVGLLVWTGFLIMFPLSIVVSILRYRLWDIDVIIRKTLVYSVLTALLALVYFGSVILWQQVLGRAGLAVLPRTASPVEQSPLAVVISTLGIAALFTPLRRRVQNAIDRRFFRKKYNAQQVLAQFAITARDETDLDALLAELVRVVDETLQPEFASVWLRETKRDRIDSL